MDADFGGVEGETHSEACWMNTWNFFFSVARGCREQKIYIYVYIYIYIHM